MTGLCCLALLLNKILLTTSFSMGNQVQLFLAASQALPAPLPTSPLSLVHTQASSLLPPHTHTATATGVAYQDGDVV